MECGKRNQDGRLSGRRQFGDCARSGAANNQVGARKSRGHVVNEWRHLAFHSAVGQFLRQLSVRRRSGLMNEPHGGMRLAKILPASAGGLVQRARSLAAARNQDGELRFAPLGSNAEEFGPHGQARDLRFARRKERAASGKLSSARWTKRPIWRLVSPGIAFGSITTSGKCFHSAAITTGPAA